MGKISTTKLISKSDTVCVTNKENESSFVYIGIRAIMGRVIVGFPEFAVLHITDATENGEYVEIKCQLDATEVFIAASCKLDA